MSSHVIKIVRCDKCGAEGRADTVTSPPLSWGRLSQDSKNFDLCPGCVNKALAKKGVPS